MTALSAGQVVGLSVAALFALIIITALITSTVERIRVAKHTGHDPRTTHIETKGAAATQQLIDKVDLGGHPSGGSKN